jgi:nucleotide-binding universal stress UspA family protein
MMVVDPTMIGGLAAAGANEVDLAKDIEREAHRAVDAAVARAMEAGVEVKGHVIDMASGEDVAAAVARFAYDHRVNVIFVGSHGRTGMLAVMLGSTAEKIVKVARCPVTVIR